MIRMYKGANLNEVDEKNLQQEIAEYLQLDNLNFLIGAGCSSHIVDDEEKGIPGMKALHEGFFTDHEDYSVLGHKLKDLFDGNLEKLLETLGAVRVANELADVDSGVDDKIDEIQKYIREEIMKGLHGNEVLKIYRDFYKKTISKNRKTPINIFTTNSLGYNR